MTFLFRKLILSLLHPFTWIFLILFAAAIFRRRRKGFCVLALICFWLFGQSSIPSMLLQRLGSRYEPVNNVQPDVLHIVVLACSRFSNPHQLETGWTLSNWEGLARLFEGVRIHRQHPDAKLWISIPSSEPDLSFADKRRAFAKWFAIPEESMDFFYGVRTTGDEAKAVAQRLDPDTAFYLVTSDYHLPRAMKTFQAQGLSPVPAPVYLDRSVKGMNLIPSPQAFEAWQRLAHEYAGLAAGYFGVFQ
jgi:uncharacterized SAM-binding protein YcdF (DUF218 family)